ncbi:MAG: ketopantoate reductase family protein [Aestuariibacter sp.]
MRIHIVGKGAIGLLIAKDLQLSNAECQLMVRDISTSPITVTDLMAKDWAISATQITVEQQEKADHSADILLLPVKTFQVLEALKQWRACIGKDTLIVILCNGIGVESAVVDMFPDNAIARGITNRAALKKSEQHVIEKGLGETFLGWLQPGKNKEESEQLISNIFPGITWQNSVLETLWKKVAINAIINPLTAIKDIPNGSLSEPRFQPIITELLTEIASLFLAKSISLSKTDLTNIIAKVITNTADNYSSMHQDIAQHKRTEIDYITGQLLLEAKKHGVLMPRNQDLYQQVKSLETRVF